MAKIEMDFVDPKLFTLMDQNLFADFCGDINPIHVDPIAARRTLHGQCIVHGIHGLLWALEIFCSSQQRAISKAKVTFLQPIFLEERVSCYWDRKDRLEIRTDETVLVTIKLKSYDASLAVISSGLGWERAQAIQHPRQQTFLEAASLKEQRFAIVGNPHLATELFPFFTTIHGELVTCEIGALSYVVGMECPGTHSLFASLNLEIQDSDSKPYFEVSSSEERFNLLIIDLIGSKITGQAQVFFRPPPTLNPTVAQISQRVLTNEFSQVRALIIGGSRGIGEVVAKIIAAGGGLASITYHVGHEDAARVSNEIKGWGGSCTAVQLTVDSDSRFLPDLTQFNQIYYFATPKIAEHRSELSDKQRHASYKNIYETAFEALCNKLIAARSRCTVFYPSTVFIVEPNPEVEPYANIKRAAEEVCEKINRLGMIQIVVARLPRLATDQNQSMMKNDFEDIVDVILPYVRLMRQAKENLV